MIKIIAAVGKNLELGKNNNLIWSLPNDLKFFKEQTKGKLVVMGRNTFNSLPKKLPGRTHWVITDVDDFNKSMEAVTVFYDFNKLLTAVKEESISNDVFIIGGASIYKQFIEYVDELVLTEVQAEDESADVYFPDFNKSLYLKEILATNEDNGIKYIHVRYIKK